MALTQEEKFTLIDEIKIIKDRLEETEENISTYGTMPNDAIIQVNIIKTNELNSERAFKLSINNEGVNKPVFMPLEVKNLLIDSLKAALDGLKGDLPDELEEKLNLLNNDGE